MQLIKWWFLGTGLVLGAGLVWSFAPILVVMAAVAAGLGVVVVAVVALARAIERRRGGAQDRPGDDTGDGEA